MKLGTWADNECYYVSVVDGPRWGLLLGPFRTHEDACAMVDATKAEAQKHDDKAFWYGYGTVKMSNGYRDGILNKFFGGDTGWIGYAKGLLGYSTNYDKSLMDKVAVPS